MTSEGDKDMGRKVQDEAYGQTWEFDPDGEGDPQPVKNEDEDQ